LGGTENTLGLRSPKPNPNFYPCHLSPSIPSIGRFLSDQPLLSPNPPGTTTKTKCPTCGEAMTKVPSRSKKMKAKHFLKCSGAGCGTVMFWNAKAKRYELPHAQRQALNPEMFVDHPCPVCGAMLERYAYTKDGQDKVMLRCSMLENRRGKCKEVAFSRAGASSGHPSLAR
jgi:predicted RNA-binding Zn-ribbon protein involved in translation (DUF1610 family)